MPDDAENNFHALSSTKKLTESNFLATDTTVNLAKLLPVALPQSQDLSAPSSPKDSLGNPSIRLSIPCTLSRVFSGHVLRDHNQGRTTVNSRRDSLSCVTLQTHDLWCKNRLTTLAHSPPQPSSSPATIQPSLLLARLSAESSLAPADSQLYFGSDGVFHSGPSFHCHQPLFASFCPSSPWMAFARSRTVLGPMGSLSAPQADILVGFFLAFALTLLATFDLGIPSLALALVWPAVLSRGDRICRMCGTSCHRAAAMRRSPSVLRSSHWLHDASGKLSTEFAAALNLRLTGNLPTLLLLHAKRPLALVGGVPTSGISQNSTTNASKTLCPFNRFRTIPTRKPSEIFSPEACSCNDRSRSYTSNFESVFPENSKWSRVKSCPAVLDLMCGSCLSTKSCQARSPSADPAVTARSRAGPEVLCRSKWIEVATRLRLFTFEKSRIGFCTRQSLYSLHLVLQCRKHQCSVTAKDN